MVALTWLDASYNQITDIAALQYVSSLTYLDLAYNEVSDITALQYPTSLSDIHLLHNQVSDVSPLVSNSGLGSGDSVGLVDNPLSDESKNVYIPQLEAKGVTVSY
jgi:Leucine-rich repeat (LRR) protein